MDSHDFQILGRDCRPGVETLLIRKSPTGREPGERSQLLSMKIFVQRNIARIAGQNYGTAALFLYLDTKERSVVVWKTIRHSYRVFLDFRCPEIFVHLSLIYQQTDQGFRCEKESSKQKNEWVFSTASMSDRLALIQAVHRAAKPRD